MKPPDVLVETDDYLVIDKPAGLPAHSGRARGRSVEDFFSNWRRGKNGPWLAHRLDQDTAGCLVIARKKKFLVRAQACFAAGLAEKTYWALVRGVPAQSHGTIDLPLAKQTIGKNWKMVPGDAPPARTEWQLMGQTTGMAWLQLYPKTGRTHQIRAHCAAIGHPVLGDAIYHGGAGALMLLARAIFLPTDPAVDATAPVPPHMCANLTNCGYAPG